VNYTSTPAAESELFFSSSQERGGSVLNVEHRLQLMFFGELSQRRYAGRVATIGNSALEIFSATAG